MALLWQLLLELHRIGWRILGAAACSTTIAFLDELQKIPIAGRHFDLSESLLNAGSALVVILLFFGIAGLLSRKKSTSYSETKSIGIAKVICGSDAFSFVKIFKKYLNFRLAFCII